MAATIGRLQVLFGIVAIPVSVQAATSEHDVRLHQVHAADDGRIRMRRSCERCGRDDVPYSEVARGYTTGGRTAVLTDADLAGLPLASVRSIEVMAFVDAASIDPLRLKTAYYLAADPATSKPYVLLRDVLAATGRAAITKVTLRTGTRESLALLRAHGPVLALQTMYWPDEIRDVPAGLAPSSEDVDVHPQEVQMAAALIERMAEGFDVAALHDDYTHALDQLVTARLEGVPVPAAAETAPPPGGVVDLMAALEASIAARDTAGPPETEKRDGRTGRRPRR